MFEHGPIISKGGFVQDTIVLPATEVVDAATHRHFAVSFFNETWDYLDKPNRTPNEWDPLESTCRHASLSIL